MLLIVSRLRFIITIGFCFLDYLPCRVVVWSFAFRMSAVKSDRARSWLYITSRGELSSRVLLLGCLPSRVIVSSFAFRLPAVERDFLSFVFSGCFCCCWIAAELLLNCCWIAAELLLLLISVVFGTPNPNEALSRLHKIELHHLPTSSSGQDVALRSRLARFKSQCGHFRRAPCDLFTFVENPSNSSPNRSFLL